jgi:type I restriction enzyme M protein
MLSFGIIGQEIFTKRLIMAATVNLGFENKLWEMAYKLRGNIESSENKHVILGLVFLKYISDSFEERFNDLKTNYEGTSENIF